jgi:hypothetical protein
MTHRDMLHDFLVEVEDKVKSQLAAAEPGSSEERWLKMTLKGIAVRQLQLRLGGSSPQGFSHQTVSRAEWASDYNRLIESTQLDD